MIHCCPRSLNFRKDECIELVHNALHTFHRGVSILFLDVVEYDARQSVVVQDGFGRLVDLIFEFGIKHKEYLAFLVMLLHILAKAFDLHAFNGNHRKLYEHIYNLIKTKKLKKFKRLENFNNTLTWVHTDCLNSDVIVF